MNTRDEDGRPAEVLLVEDTPGDVRLTLEAFRDANQTTHLHVVVDGVEALVKSINEFWLTKVTLPRPQPEGR